MFAYFQESPRDRKSEKVVRKRLTESKGEQEQKNQEPPYIIKDENAMDKEVADTIRDHKRKHDDDNDDDDDDEGPSVGSNQAWQGNPVVKSLRDKSDGRRQARPPTKAGQGSFAQRGMMRIYEVHKFSDGTLTRIKEKLDFMVKDFKLFKFNKGMENRKWTEDDKRRSEDFIEDNLMMEMEMEIPSSRDIK
ncbi:hypothetical protein Tco_0282054 [Tanacetum coccineum]